MLYIVATPIGNLDDISMRAISVLNRVDFILAEDTRVTQKLLNKYNIQTKLINYHHHSSFQKIEYIIELLENGKDMALVSDAGTPGINDPGNYLISQALKKIPDLKVTAVPGPNAAIAALSVSGFPTDKFVYLGFPPHKKSRQTVFKKIGQTNETVVFYESKYRILKALKELKELSDVENRQIMIAREITKQFETVYRGTVDEVLAQLSRNKDHLLGEFVIVISKK